MRVCSAIAFRRAMRIGSRAARKWCHPPDSRFACRARWTGWWSPITPTGWGWSATWPPASRNLLKYAQAARWSEGLAAGGEASVEAALDLITNFSQGTVDPELMALYSPGSKLYKNLWEKVIDDAEAFNDPGRFTALIGFEWTSLIKGNNMHRVVIMRDGPVRARQVVPFTMTAPQGSPDPRDLWKYLTNYEEETGGEVLAIPHNGNLSNGIMFPLEAQWNGKKLDKTYVTQRDKWEPLYEVTQIKGDGETHPFLSPDDEFADYETWDIGNLDVSEAKTDDMLAGEYAREALKRGLAIETRLGTNPYKFGMIGATDSHTSLADAEEDNFFGKHTGYEPKPERMSHPFMENENGAIMGWQMVASGLAAVWATENTREAIFDAMQRKEVYATTGPRMTVRLFGGWDFTKQDVQLPHAGGRGLRKGRADGRRPAGHARGCEGAELHGLRAARSDRRQPRPHPDRQGLARRRRHDAREGLRRRLVGRPRAGPRRQAARRRQHRRRRQRELDQHDRRRRAGDGLDRSRLRPDAEGVLLCARARDPDPALDDV